MEFFAANPFTHSTFMAMMPSPVTLGAMFLTMGLSQEFNMSSLTTNGQPDQQVAMDNLRELGKSYHLYLHENNGSHIPASVSGVHGWAMELEDKVGYDDASVYLLDGDLVQVEHEGDIAESVRDKSFPGMPFSISLVVGFLQMHGSTTPQPGLVVCSQMVHGPSILHSMERVVSYSSMVMLSSTKLSTVPS